MAKSIGSKTPDGAGASESVADVLDRELKSLITNWYARVEKAPDVMRVPLNYEERTGHLPKLMHDVTARVRLEANTNTSVSESAAHHGELRRKQGYTVEMLIEESRLLQVCIFTALHKKHGALGIQFVAFRHCNYRRRGRCTIKTTDETLQRSKYAGNVYGY